MNKINLSEKLDSLDQHWFPALIANIDDFEVKVVKLDGEFIWHSHENNDEMFLVVEGAFDMHFRDQTVSLASGEMIVVPKGVEHKPVALEECKVVVIEKQGLVNTGDAAVNSFTRETLPRI